MDLPKQKRGSNTVGRIQEALKRTLRNEGIQGLPRMIYAVPTDVTAILVLWKRDARTSPT